MNVVLEIIKDQGVPTDSPNAAAQYLGENGIGQLNNREYINRIRSITEKTVSYENEDMYRMVYKYLCAEAITSQSVNTAELLTTAETKAEKLITENSWMFVKSEEDPKLDDNGNTKPKKGAKKELAMKVYAEDIKDKVTVRKDAIAILVEKAGMTPAGASTYYANLKKNNGVL